MNKHGFYRIAAAIPQVRVAEVDYNLEQIKSQIDNAAKKNVQVICFPELSVTAYTCGDLFFQAALINATEKGILNILAETKNIPVTFILGAPVVHNSKLYNCALVCRSGVLLGVIPKVHLPNYNEFYEKRWFEPYEQDTTASEIIYAGQTTAFGTNLLFDFGRGKFAVEICEDLWSVIPPSSYHVTAGAHLVFNLSASNELTGKQQYVKSLLAQQSARCIAGYVYASAGFGESSTDVVYSGNAYIYENGRLLAESERFKMEEQMVISEADIELIEAERRKNTTFTSRKADNVYRTVLLPAECNDNSVQLLRSVNPTPFIPCSENYGESCEEIFSIQVAGLAKRVVHTSAKSLVIGVSGGLDSTLALLVCVKTADMLNLPREMVLGVAMSGFGTTGRTAGNALKLMKALNTGIREISIIPACEQHFRDIGHDPHLHDVTYENTQARERTQILMDLANSTGGLVVGTGDMSELALGWATYNGDHISMYGVNAGIPKTLVRHLIKWVSENHVDKGAGAVMADILATPVSPELLPAGSGGQMTQFTEDLIGPYELHDFFLYYMLRYGFSPSKIFFLARHAFSGKYDNDVILKWIKVFYARFFSQQYKRSCLPDGPKVGSVNLSPRGDWRMPSDAGADIWLKDV
ncbi:MAG: NAD(+) synthase [Dysgonamonadaceae bacterium]|jgi:NAD+ synthase (glutamine-hydrolysing)|nr:NAD(+) synthase [Dysgonamonadaceae bacterium]